MRSRSSPSRKRSAAEALVTRLDARADGKTTPRADSIPTGFPSVDRLLGGGLRRQDVVVLAGDVGAGKSSLALAIAVRSARAGSPVVYLSGEMSEERLIERAIALEARVPVGALRSGGLDDASRAAVGAAALSLRDIPLRVRPLATERFETIADALGAGPRPGLLVLDDLQLATSPLAAESADEREAATIRALKGMALEHDLALLVLAQLPHFRPGRRDPRPTLEDLGGKGVVKQVADVVLAIYREEMYQPNPAVEGAVELIIAKNRNGPTGYLDLYFHRHWLRFEDMLDPER